MGDNSNCGSHQGATRGGTEPSISGGVRYGPGFGYDAGAEPALGFPGSPQPQPTRGAAIAAFTKSSRESFTSDVAEAVSWSSVLGGVGFATGPGYVDMATSRVPSRSAATGATGTLCCSNAVGGGVVPGFGLGGGGCSSSSCGIGGGLGRGLVEGLTAPPGFAPLAGSSFQLVNDGQEREDAFVSSLRREVDELLRTNLALQAQLRNAAVSEGGASASFAGDTQASLADDEERKTLRERASELAERRCQLEAKVGLARAEATANANAQDSVYLLTSERDRLAVRLRAEEEARAAAARQADETEERLARTREESDRLLRRQRQSDGPEGVAETARCGEEAKELRRRLAELRATCSEHSGQLRICDERLERNSQATLDLKADQEALASTHGALQAEASALADQLRDRLGARTAAHAELDNARLKHADRDLELRSDVLRLQDNLRSLSDAVERSQAQLHISEVSAEAARKETSETKGLLASLRCISDEFASSAKTLEDTQVRELRILEEAVQADMQKMEGLSSAIHLQQQEISRLEAVSAQGMQRLAELQHACALEQRQSTHHDEEAKLTCANLGSRAEALSWQLQGERQREAELSEQVAAMFEAASTVQQQQSPSRRSPSKRRQQQTPPQRRRRQCRTPLDDRENTDPLLAEAHSKLDPKGWSRARIRLQTELADMRLWRMEAAESVQRMGAALEATRMGYQKQLQYGRDLEASIAHLGSRAQAAASSSPRSPHAPAFLSTPHAHAPSASAVLASLGVHPMMTTPTGSTQGLGLPCAVPAASSSLPHAVEDLANGVPPDTVDACAGRSPVDPSVWTAARSSVPLHVYSGKDLRSETGDDDSEYSSGQWPTANGVFYADATGSALRARRRRAHSGPPGCGVCSRSFSQGNVLPAYSGSAPNCYRRCSCRRPGAQPRRAGLCSICR